MILQISNREHRRLEDMARRGNLHGLYAYFADLHEPIYLDKQLLIGSMFGESLYLKGHIETHAALSHFYSLDSVYDQNTYLVRTIGTRKRSAEETRSLQPSIRGAIHRHYLKSLPKLCFLSGFSECSNKVIHAHAIQEAQIKPFSKNGEVYFASPLDDREDKLPLLKLLSIQKATTFKGFCGKHDDETFRPIEKKVFCGTSEQLFLYHFRALCKEHYLRLHTKTYLERVTAELTAHDGDSQMRSVKNWLEATKLDLSEMESGMPRFQKILKTKDFGQLSGCWTRGSGTPGLLFTALIFPQKDLLNRPFLNRSSIELQSWISMTVTIENNSPLAMVVGTKGCPILTQMTDSMQKIPGSELSAALCRYALACTENFVVLPSWWESLDPNAQRAARLLFSTRFYTSYFKGPFNWSFESPTVF